MDSKTLRAIEERAAKATPRPWTYEEPDNAESTNPYERESYVCGPKSLPLPDTHCLEPCDARFVANARSDVPDLCIEVWRLVKVLKSITRADNPRDMCDAAVVAVLEYR